MGFLAPGLLLLGLAAAVPIVLHLLQRQPGPRRVFPALRYLRQAERESARRVRLRQLLLLAARVGALLLLALAAARPFLPGGDAEHPPTAVALVLDNSLSAGLVAGEERVLDVLKARALATLERAGPGDRFWVLRAAEPWIPAAPGSAEEAAAQVRATEVVAARADLAGALRRARGLLAAGAEGRPTEIHLLSDLQATALPDPLPGESETGLLVWLPGGAAPPNTGVVAVEVAGGLAPRAGQRSSVAARVAGSGDSVGVRLLVGGQVRGVAQAAPGAGALLPLPAHPPGVVSGAVEIDADALRGDDRRWFVARVAPAPAVALTAGAPFVEEALAVLAEAGRVRLVGRAEADVRVAPGGAGAEALRSGSTVVVLAPPSPLELPALNRRLAAAGIPWRYDPPAGAGAARVAAPADDEELARVLEPARLELSYPLRRDDGGTGADTVLLALAEGAPWLVRGERPGGGRYLLLGSPLAPEGGSVAASAAMVPLVDRLVGSWAEAAEAVPDRLAGAPLPLPGRASAVVRPDGTREPVEGGAPYRGALQTGIYRVLAGQEELAVFAVNAPPEETPLARLGRGELEARLPQWTLRVAEDPDAWADLAYGLRRGGEAWWPLALGALLLLAVELLLAGSGASPGRASPARAREAEGVST